MYDDGLNRGLIPLLINIVIKKDKLDDKKIQYYNTIELILLPLQPIVPGCSFDIKNLTSGNIVFYKKVYLLPGGVQVHKNTFRKRIIRHIPHWITLLDINVIF